MVRTSWHPGCRSDRLFTLNSRDKLNRRLYWFGIGALLIAIVGLVVGGFADRSPELAAKLLRYYWFRLTDAIIPFVLAVFVAQVGFAASDGQPRDTRKVGSYLSRGLIAISIFGLLWSSFSRSLVTVPPSATHRLVGFKTDATGEAEGFADWLTVCRWIQIAMPRDEVFFTPRHQQSFKWYAHRAEVVNWKDVPQDATSLIEWERRFYEVYPASLGRSRVTINYNKLLQYREQYGVRFMVVDNRIAGKQLPLVKVYPVGDQVNETFSVYELPYAR